MPQAGGLELGLRAGGLELGLRAGGVVLPQPAKTSTRVAIDPARLILPGLIVPPLPMRDRSVAEADPYPPQFRVDGRCAHMEKPLRRGRPDQRPESTFRLLAMPTRRA
jgi:hypothetical protein